MKRQHQRKEVRQRREVHKRLPGDAGMSREQVADALGISDARVGQIEEAALAKLRRAFARLGLRELS